MAKHTHVIRKKIKAAINQNGRVQDLIEELYGMATSDETPAATRRACIKDLLEFGISVEKDIASLTSLGEELSDGSDKDDQKELMGVVVKMTAD